MRYGVLIDGEPGAYGVIAPDLPGCTAMGNTIEEALANLSAAFQDWVEAAERRSEVPQPRDLDALRADLEVADALRKGATMASVFLTRPSRKPVKADLSLDEGVIAALDAAAQRVGVTRSDVVELLVRRNLAELPD